MKKLLKIVLFVIGGFVVLIILGTIFGGDSFKKGLKEGYESGVGQGENTETQFKDQREITEENVKTALKNLSDTGHYVMEEDKITKITVSNFPDEGITVNVYVNTGNTWNEKDMVKMSAGTATEVMRRLFTNSKVNEVIFFTYADFIDQYGNTTNEKALHVGMKRETADKINWDEFENLVAQDYNNLFDITTNVNIKPSVANELK